MSELIAMRNEITRIKDQLEKAFYGGAWHGPSVTETLNGTSSNKAAAKPVGGAHSIWEIVLHLSVWHSAVRKRLLGYPANITDEEDWQQIKDVSEISWAKDLIKLRNCMDELIDTVEKFDQTKLDDKAEGKNYSNYFMLHGLVQHDIYHSGQIALLKIILI